MAIELLELLPPDAVRLRVDASNAEGVLRAIAAAIGPRVRPSEDAIVRSLAEREALGTTAVGSGVAIPHTKIEGVDGLAAALVITTRGIDFGAADRQPVRIFFALLSSPPVPGTHLQAMARIAAVLYPQEVRAELLAAQTSADVCGVIERAERRHDAARAAHAL